NGSFRLFYDAFSAEDTTRGCVTDAESDADATALALAALRSVEPGPAVTAAIDDAVTWLLTLQYPVTGAFSGTPPTNAPNSNTTGLAAHALAALGIVEPAENAAAWIDTLRLSSANTTGTPALGEEGAIAYNP